MVAPCIVFGAVLLLFLALGVVFALGKGQGIIAGYNTASAREREKIDEKKLLRIMRNGMFALAGCTAVSLIGLLTGIRPILYAGFVLFIVTIVVLVIRANTGTRK